MLDIFPSLGRPGYDGSQSLPLGAARDREAASRPPLPPAMLRELSDRQSPQVAPCLLPLCAPLCTRSLHSKACHHMA